MSKRNLCITCIFGLLMTVIQAKPASPCLGKATDILFVLDSSSSIWIVDYKEQLKFVADLVDNFKIEKGKSQARVGVITFSDQAYLEFPLGRYSEPAQMKKAISNIIYRTGGTNTANALKLARSQVEPKIENRKAPVVAIVITDGKSSDRKATKEEAQQLHQLGINVYAIGVGDESKFDINELKAIASDPVNGVYTVATYSALKEIAQKLYAQACEDEATTPEHTTTSKAASSTTTITESSTIQPTTTTTRKPFIKIVPSTINLRPTEKAQYIRKKVDIMFLLDSSGSIGEENFKIILNFTTGLMHKFNDSSKVRVGVITFSDQTKVEFSVDSYTNPAQLKRTISKFAYRQRTSTAIAFRLLKEQFKFNLKNSAIANVVISITDGQSTDLAAIEEAKKLRQDGIKVYAIGVGVYSMYDIDILKAIVSDPDNDVYTVASYSALKDMAQELHNQLCEGGYKGYGLALMTEVFCGILAGANYGPNIRSWKSSSTAANLGQCFVALDPSAFAPGFTDRMSDIMTTLRNMTPVEGQPPVMVPGDHERKHEEKCATLGGIPYHPNQIEFAETLADELGIDRMKIKTDS